MAVSDAQLETWSHQGSKAQSAATYETVRRVLLDSRAPYANRSFDIFLQGSYNNDTNIYADSDVDIVVCLTSTYYDNQAELAETEQVNLKRDWVAASYSYHDFRRDVLKWLTDNFGTGVKAGKKAIFIPAGSGRREVDVLVAAEFKHYTYYRSVFDQHHSEGICFWPTDNSGRVVNYPKQHAANCTQLHQSSGARFKPTVRMLKNMRNRMTSEGHLNEGDAPSYFLEGMLYNVPSAEFVSSNVARVANCLNWLDRADQTKLVCANERFYLLHPSSPVTWRAEKFQAYLRKTISYWNAW